METNEAHDNNYLTIFWKIIHKYVDNLQIICL